MGYLRDEDIKDITDHVLRRKNFYTNLIILSSVIIVPQLVFYALTYFVR